MLFRSADQPVEPGACEDADRSVRRIAIQGHQVADLGDLVGIGLHQGVARATEVAHEAEFEGLQILDAAPDEAGGRGAGLARKVASLHEGHFEPLGAQRGRGDCAVDATAHDQDVERPLAEALQLMVDRKSVV